MRLPEGEPGRLRNEQPVAAADSVATADRRSWGDTTSAPTGKTRVGATAQGQRPTTLEGLAALNAVQIAECLVQ